MRTAPSTHWIDKARQNPHSCALFRAPGRYDVANTLQAKKRARQAETRREHNTSRRSLMRSQIKKVLKAVADKDQNAARQALRDASSMIDRAAAKGLVHKNVANRYKSRLNNRVRTLASANP